MPDLNSLINTLRGLYSSGKFSQDGVKYGPAMTRIGRTPVDFTTNIPTTSGVYYPPVIYGKGQIKVNPANPDNKDIMATIAHEDLHSILSSLDWPRSGKLKNMAETNPYYSTIAGSIGQTRGGDMPSEVPAYMGAYTDAFTPEIPTSLRTLYTNYFMKQLQQEDPIAAAKFAKIAMAPYGTKSPMRLTSNAGNTSQ